MTTGPLILVLPVPNYDDAVVNFPVRVGTVEVLLGYDPARVGLKHPRGVDGNTQGLLSNDLLHLVVGHTVLLLEAHILPVVEICPVTSTRCVAPIVFLVLFSDHDSVLGSVLVGFIHPAAITGIVDLVAIE